MKLIKDLGMKYPSETAKRKYRYGLYQCPNCPNQVETASHAVKSGSSTQCKSCSNKVKTLKHGGKGTVLYSRWIGMKNRCNNPDGIDYCNYGAKGITVCNEWIDDFSAFKEWAEENGFNEELTLDKDIICERENIIPKIYSPDTCMWVTKSENTLERHNRCTKK